MARQAGREAEDLLVAALRQLAGVAPRQVFSAVRVPLWTASRGRRGPSPSQGDGFAWVDTPSVTAGQLRLRWGEIDIVVVTLRGVFALEVKNWSGTVDIDPTTGRWKQTRSRTREVVDHGDLNNSLNGKVSGLLEHLARHGIALPPASVQPRIIFVNPNCRFTEAARAAESIVLPTEVAAFVTMFERSVSGHLADMMMPCWLSGCSIKLRTVIEMCAVVESTCRTWDVLILTSGIIFEGDFLAVVTGSAQGNRQTLDDIGAQRQGTDRLELKEHLTIALDTSPLARMRDDMVTAAVQMWDWIQGDTTDKVVPIVLGLIVHARPESFKLRAVDLALHPILGDAALPAVAADPAARGPVWEFDWFHKATPTPVLTLDPVNDGVLFHCPGDASPKFYPAATVSTVKLGSCQ
eukprot:m.37205 g.37205  ORF g.37205 m.37205 type:complete len:408 (+) comp13016_c0_seq3:87-1310(+)